jgi:hypothetical protein
MQNAGCTALITPVISTPCCEFAMMAMAITGIPHPHPRPHTRAPAARSPQPAARSSPQPAVAAVAVAVAVVAALVGGTRRAAHQRMRVAHTAYECRVACNV